MSQTQHTPTVETGKRRGEVTRLVVAIPWETRWALKECAARRKTTLAGLVIQLAAEDQARVVKGEAA
jgi:hypothetical protein